MPSRPLSAGRGLRPKRRSAWWPSPLPIRASSLSWRRRCQSWRRRSASWKRPVFGPPGPPTIPVRSASSSAGPMRAARQPWKRGDGSMEVAILASLKHRLALHGLILRGGFHPDPEEGLGATLLLVGNAGAAMWQSFEPHIDDLPDPLNRWTREVIEPIAAEFGALPRYPFGEPH